MPHINFKYQSLFLLFCVAFLCQISEYSQVVSFKQAGYFRLDGSKVIAVKLQELERSYSFHIVKGRGQEIARITSVDLDKKIKFFNQTVLNNEVIQTKIIKIIQP